MLVLAGAVTVMGTAAWAAHPLITDDTGTQGKGKFQLEVNGETVKDKDGDEELGSMALGVAFAAGLRDDLDIIVGMPFVSYKAEVGGTTVADEQGPGDVVIEAKLRFFERGGLGFAFKPGITLPTGDDNKGLGTGETGEHLYWIASMDREPLTFHGNIGYIRNENNAGEEENLWHLSLAAEYAATGSTRIVGNMGMERNPDPAAEDDPAFGLVGVIYSPKEQIDLDVGVKFGLNDAEDDLAFLAGVAIRF